MGSVRIFRSGIHLGEERIIEGNYNSGMITLSGCHLACNFCYTPETSVEERGVDVSATELVDLIEELVARGARNLNLITPSHVWGILSKPLTRIKMKYGTRLPLILKITGYEKEGVLRGMSEIADVFVPDFKVWSAETAASVNLPRDYGQVAQNAIAILSRTHGNPLYSRDGKLSCGILVRHLMMPDCFEDSLKVVDALAETGYRGYINFMTYFVDTKKRRVVNANPEEKNILAIKALNAGMDVLVNGKEALSLTEVEAYAEPA